MNVIEVLSLLAERGVKIERRGENLGVQSIGVKIDDDLRLILKEHKQALLTFLDEEKDFVPVSSGQRQMWLLDKLEGLSPAYNAIACLRIKGSLNKSVLEWAFSELIERHEVLRTEIVMRNGDIRQRVGPSVPFEVALVDVTGKSPEAVDVLVVKTAEEYSSTRFKFEGEALIRAALFGGSEDASVLILVLPHLAGDGLSMQLLYEELDVLYNQKLLKQDIDLDSPTAQYRDYAVRQQALQLSRVGSQAESALADFWSTYLIGSSPVAALTDNTGSAEIAFAGRTHRFRIRQDQATRLKSLAAAEGTSLFTVLLSIFSFTLSQRSGYKDIVVATPIVDRPERRFEKSIGYFLNTVPIRCAFSNAENRAQLIASVHRSVRSAVAHADMPFEKIAQVGGQGGAEGRMPIYQVMFALQNASRSKKFLFGFEVEEIEFDPPTARHDLTLMLDEDDDGFLGRLEYRTRLFHPSSMSDLANQLIRLVTAFCDGSPQLLEAFVATTEEDLATTQVASQEYQLAVVDGSGRRLLRGVAGSLVAVSRSNEPLDLHTMARWTPWGALQIISQFDRLQTLESPSIDAAPPLEAVQSVDDWVGSRAVLAGIWSSLLGQPPSSLADDFFAHGGTSMSLMEVNWHLHQRFGLEMPIAELMGKSSFGEMSDLVERELDRHSDDQVLVRSTWQESSLPVRGAGHLWNMYEAEDGRVWAAGMSEVTTGSRQTRSVLIHRTDGVWQEIQHPDLEKIYGMSMSASGALWVSGRRGLLRYQGDQFVRVENGAPTADCASITAVREDLWTLVRSGAEAGAETSVYVGDGVKPWERLPLPLPEKVVTRFGCISGISSDDVWVSLVLDTLDGSRISRVFHWDGLAWCAITPNDGLDMEIMRVASVGRDSCWAMGALLVDGRRVSAIWRWDGSEWSQMSLPSQHVGRVNSMSFSKEGRMWAAGGGGGDAGLVLFSDDLGLSWQSDVTPSQCILIGDVLALENGAGILAGGATNHGMAVFTKGSGSL